MIDLKSQILDEYEQEHDLEDVEPYALMEYPMTPSAIIIYVYAKSPEGALLEIKNTYRLGLTLVSDNLYRDATNRRFKLWIGEEEISRNVLEPVQELQPGIYPN